MNGYIDIAKLQSRKSELENEIKQLDAVLTFAATFFAPETTKIVAPAKLPTEQKLPFEKKRSCTPGLRRAVILALNSGSANLAELSRCLGWSYDRTYSVVGTMVKFKICFLNEHGQIQLAEQGKDQAAWYSNHPGMLTYRPGNKYLSAKP